MSILSEIWKRVRSLATFVRDAVFHAKRKKTVFADPLEVIRRKAICDLCVHLKNGICDQCGCVMSLKVKFAAAKCYLPEDRRKW